MDTQLLFNIMMSVIVVFLIIHACFCQYEINRICDMRDNDKWTFDQFRNYVLRKHGILDKLISLCGYDVIFVQECPRKESTYDLIKIKKEKV